MTDYHESWDALPDDVKDMHRALASLQEEIEAVDWYNQRQAVCTDEQLRQILVHNRDEEIEHACMALEWLRRVSPRFDEQLRTYLFTSAPVTEVEEAAADGGDAGAGGGDLGIGKID